MRIVVHRLVLSGALAAGLFAPLPHAVAWEPGFPGTPDGRAPSRGFVVDTTDRDDVVAFWHAIYEASDSYDQHVGWTGRFPDRPGTLSDAFEADVERRINYFRAMCGIPANARVNSGAKLHVRGSDHFKADASATKAEACQAAALMVARSYNPTTGTVVAMDHDPDSSVAGWSKEAWNAAANGNLAFGLYGPDAITEYMGEEVIANTTVSAWNSLVGHRRWILVPGATNFATGDYPGESVTRLPANVLYVIQRPDEVASLAAEPFVSYPAAGFFPAPLNSRFWSLSRKGADFSGATVRVFDGSGAPVPVSNVRANNDYGDEAIVWKMNGEAAASFVRQDTSYRVVVRGIAGDGIPATHEYTVTLINPYQLRSSVPFAGPSSVAAGKAQRFSVRKLDGVRSTRVTSYQRTLATWTEGGESGKPGLIDGTSPEYPMLATEVGADGGPAISGEKSINLTFPSVFDLRERGVPQQVVELDRWIFPGSGGTLKFKYQRGLMTEASRLVVEVSRDAGITWKRVGGDLRGESDARPDTSANEASYTLPRSKRDPLRVRFRYFLQGKTSALATYKDFPGMPTGIFLDDIRLVNCDWLQPRKVSTVGGSKVTFRPPAGAQANEQWALGMTADFGGPLLQVGKMKTVRIRR